MRERERKGEEREKLVGKDNKIGKKKNCGQRGKEEEEEKEKGGGEKKVVELDSLI